MGKLHKAGALCAALGFAAGVSSAQHIGVRVENSPNSFTPLHSYATGEHEGDVLFFSGISGMGLHGMTQNGTQVSFPVNTFSRRVFVVDHTTGIVRSGTTDHLSPQLREALTITNPAYLQEGGFLYIFGGYGPTNAGDNWTTRGTQTRIDLAAVRAAVLADQPLPEAAFEVTTDAESQLTGGRAIDLGEKFALVGGAIFTGDYGRLATATFTEQYKIQVNVFDKSDKVNPTQTFGQTAGVPSQDRLRRRDMNALPAMLPPSGGGEERRPGFAVLGGVFRQAAFGWTTPLTHAADDGAIVHHTTFTQHMNQYEGPAASLYSTVNDQNRFLLFSGISAYTWNGVSFVTTNPTLFNIPWTAEITEITTAGGEFTNERVMGVMPNPVVNGELVINERIPRLANGQIDLDEMPASEVLLGRIYGGLRAAAPAVAPATYASGVINDVFIVVGVRGDVTRDGIVNAADLAQLLGAWGSDATRTDLNLDGVVNSVDLGQLLGAWGNNVPG